LGWIRVTKDNPCPLCGREKWCMTNANGSAIVCTKQPSDRSVGESGGWLHILDPERNAGFKMSEMEQWHFRYNRNLIEGIDEIVSELLGVSVESIRRLEVGFWPFGHLWTFPERDERGKIIGVLKRTNKGTKHMEKGGKRGLIYECPLPDTDKPIIVVEGATDTLAAMDMGYVAIGRPSAEGGAKILRELLKGRDVIIIGENDDAGRKGMEKMYRLLGETCKSVQKILPPAKHKDLRAWHPTAEEFELWLEQKAERSDESRVIEEVNQYELAQRYIDDNWMDDDYRTFHQVHDDWYHYNGSYYERTDGRKDQWLNNDLFKYFNTFSVLRHTQNDVRCDRLNPTRKFIEDVKFSLASLCHVGVPNGIFEPFHIENREQLDVEKLVVFRNGILDIDTMTLRPFHPDIFVTSTLPYDYNPRAKCPLTRGFVRDIFNADEQSHDLLQEWAGYNMIASNRMQQMMMLYGVRNSGKSTTARVLQALLGPERVSSFSFDKFKDRFGPYDLFGKYAAIISEDRTTNHVDSEKLVQQLKKIIGEDTVKLERKYRDPFDAQLFCRFTYVGNELPRFHDDQGAFLRRFNLLYYPNDYTQEEGKIDRRLPDKLIQEIPGIANWALEGLQRLLANGEFTRPAATKEHLADYCELSSPLSTMVKQHCQFGDSSEFFIPIHWMFDLHKAVYEEWGLKPMGSALFRVRFKSVFPKLIRKRRSVGGRVVPVWAGVKIKERSKQQYLGAV